MHIERLGLPARLDAAEAAPPRALVAHEHDGGGCAPAIAAPALANVGAARLFAHGVQAEAAQVALERRVGGAGRDRGAEVRREAGSEAEGEGRVGRNQAKRGQCRALRHDPPLTS